MASLAQAEDKELRLIPGASHGLDTQVALSFLAGHIAFICIHVCIGAMHGECLLKRETIDEVGVWFDDRKSSK